MRNETCSLRDNWPGKARPDRQIGSIARSLRACEGPQWRGRRIGLAIEVLHMPGEIAQLTRFVDQAGLFLANCPVTNKLHFSSLPRVVLFLGCFMEQGAGKFNC